MTRPAAVRARRRGADGSDRGAVTVTQLITIPVIVTVTLIVVQVAVVFMAHNAAAAAAQNGISLAREYGSSLDAGRQATLDYLTETAGGLITAPQVTADRDGDLVTVTVTGTAMSVVPFLNLAIEASQSGPVEQAVIE